MPPVLVLKQSFLLYHKPCFHISSSIIVPLSLMNCTRQFLYCAQSCWLWLIELQVSSLFFFPNLTEQACTVETRLYLASHFIFLQHTCQYICRVSQTEPRPNYCWSQSQSIQMKPQTKVCKQGSVNYI